MNRKSALLFVALFLIIGMLWAYFASISPENVETGKPLSGWSQSSSPGELTETISYFAVSARTTPTRKLNYPYEQIAVSLGFGCDGSDEWMYLSFSEPPNIDDAVVEEESNRYTFKIQFDDDSARYAMTQKFGTRSLHFKDDAQVAQRVLDASSMTLEVNWYSEGVVRFVFALEGSAEAIAAARGKCNTPLLI